MGIAHYLRFLDFLRRYRESQDKLAKTEEKLRKANKLIRELKIQNNLLTGK